MSFVSASCDPQIWHVNVFIFVSNNYQPIPGNLVHK
jgi:hypothetical protein